MMKVLLGVILFTLVACGTPNSDASTKGKEMDPQVALGVMNDYASNCNALKDSDKWVENQELLTAEFKKDYKKMMQEAWEDDPEMGLGFDPIFKAQDYPEKGFVIKATDPKKGIVTLQGIDWPDFIVVTRLVSLNDQWLLDGAGAVRMQQ